VRPDLHPVLGRVLLVDAGSTRTKLALVTGGELVRLGSFATGGGVGWEDRFAAAAAVAGVLDAPGVAHVAVAAAVRSLPDRLGAWLRRRGHGTVPVRAVTAATAGLPVDYRRPATLGPDRIADAVAAAERWGAPVVVADVGTAVTCDLVAAGPRFAGGAIAPGPEAAYRGLVEAAPQLARRSGGLRPHAAAPAVPTSTDEAVRSGVLRGLGALIDGLARDYQRRVGPCPVVATGGLADVAARYSEAVTAVDLDLTLWGIHLAALAREPA
jgi:type III pantothenate kinase